MPFSSLSHRLLYLLTHKVRVITYDQVVRHLYGDGADRRDQARCDWRQLHADGWLAVRSTLAHPLVALDEPILPWSPGDSAPTLSAVAKQLRGRWTAMPEPTSLAWATRKASRRFGGYVGGTASRRTEITHDIHMTEIYFRYLREFPTVARWWRCDREIVARGGGRGEHVPDAVLWDRRHCGARHVIEFGGAYPRRKVEAFHVAFRHLTYDLW